MTTGDSATEAHSHLRVVKGDPSPEEVAALVAVLQGLAGAGDGESPPPPRSEWAAPHRRLRTVFPSGPGAWRSSALPR